MKQKSYVLAISQGHQDDWRSRKLPMICKLMILSFKLSVLLLHIILLTYIQYNRSQMRNLKVLNIKFHSGEILHPFLIAWLCQSLTFPYQVYWNYYQQIFQTPSLFKITFLSVVLANVFSIWEQYQFLGNKIVNFILTVKNLEAKSHKNQVDRVTFWERRLVP